VELKNIQAKKMALMKQRQGQQTSLVKAKNREILELKNNMEALKSLKGAVLGKERVNQRNVDLTTQVDYQN